MTGVPLLVFKHENKSNIIEARAGIGIFNSGQLQKFATNGVPVHYQQLLEAEAHNSH